MSDRTEYLLRYGELFLKGRNRPFFERRQVEAVSRAVGSLGGRVERLHGRILVDAPAEVAAEVEDRLGAVFGLTSFSPVLRVAPRMDEIETVAVQVARQLLSEWGGGQRPSFKIAARRSNKRFPMTSPEIARQAGAAVVAATSLPVSLGDPDMTVEVEIGRDSAFVAARRLPGPGGLPPATAAPVSLLLSGGIDSPVAGWLLLKRGCSLRPITFESPPYTGPEAREKVLDLCRHLARWAGPLPLRVVRFTEVQQLIRTRCPASLAVVLYRRMMLRVAELAAEKDGAAALGTGDAIGQVASQTVENLHCVGAVTRLPVLRPLVTHDKAETVDLARRIGTYEISIRPHVDCCSLFVPEHPETRARLEWVEEAEARLPDPQGLARELLASSEVIPIADPWRGQGLT